jgi:glycosyltransferase involved in cell wall biosynthesis
MALHPKITIIQAPPHSSWMSWAKSVRAAFSWVTISTNVTINSIAVVPAELYKTIKDSSVPHKVLIYISSEYQIDNLYLELKRNDYTLVASTKLVAQEVANKFNVECQYIQLSVMDNAWINFFKTGKFFVPAKCIPEIKKTAVKPIASPKKLVPTAQKQEVTPPEPELLQKVILLPHTKGWVFDRISNQLLSGLKTSFDCKKVFADESTTLPDCAAIVFWWKDYYLIKDKKRSLICLYDHASWTEEDIRTIFTQFGAIGVSNKILKEQVQKILSGCGSAVPIYEIQDGVDTKVFTPPKVYTETKKLRVGWVGNSKWGKKRDKKADVKGFKLLQEIMEQTKAFIDWAIVDKESSSLSFDKMPGVYKNLDVILCLSSSEGTPNPVLEGAACGCLPVTTNIGIVPELISDGVVIKIIDRSVKSAVQTLHDLHADRTLIVRSFAENPAVIKRHWDWRLRIPIWKRLLTTLPVVNDKATINNSAIVLLPDVENWAFDRISNQIIKYLGSEFCLDKRTVSNKGTTADDEHAVLFWLFSHSRVMNKAYSAVCLYDFFSWTHQDIEAICSQFGVVLVANKLLKTKLLEIPFVQQSKLPILEVQDGVDTKLFTPPIIRTVNKTGKLRVGWAGNLNWGNSASNSPDYKGATILQSVMHQTTDIIDWVIIDKTSNPVDFNKMPDVWQGVDIVTCFSLGEGTPNPVLEGAACGCLPVTTNVGLVPELLADGCVAMVVDRTPEAFIHAFKKLFLDRTLIEKAHEINPVIMRRCWDWSIRINNWRNALLYVNQLDNKPTTVTQWVLGGREGQDYSDQLTVFVTTIGAPDFEHCLKSLSNQDCLFRLQVIANVSPMSVAFQKMIDSCTTTYYIQVDEDMLLYPSAIRKLYCGMLSKSSDVAIHFESLVDDFTGFCLVGIKIYRHLIMKKYPYDTKDFSCEVDQVTRLQRDGYSVTGNFPGLTGDKECCVGALNKFWTPWTIFEKYSRDLQKYRLYPDKQKWMSVLPKLFLSKLIQRPNDILSLCALLGTVVGLTYPTTMVSGEKDAKNPTFLPCFDTLKSLLLE